MSDEKFKMHRGEIIFTEPDEKGRYHQESFELKDAEVEDFSREIEKISRGKVHLEDDDDYEEHVTFHGPCTCEHTQEDHSWGHCDVDGCNCEAGWEE